MLCYTLCETSGNKTTPAKEPVKNQLVFWTQHRARCCFWGL